MRFSSVLLVAVCLVLGGRAQAQDAEPPLFSAFKTFCADAGADPDQVKLAVEMAGGKAHNPPGGSTDKPWPMTVMSWDVTVQGHRMILSIGTAHPPRGPDKVSNTTNCVINSLDDESASMEALREWAGVPRDPTMPFPEYYNFRRKGAAHVPAAGEAGLAEEEESWQLVLIGKNSLQLAHWMAPTPRKTN